MLEHILCHCFDLNNKKVKLVLLQKSDLSINFFLFRNRTFLLMVFVRIKKQRAYGCVIFKNHLEKKNTFFKTIFLFGDTLYYVQYIICLMHANFKVKVYGFRMLQIFKSLVQSSVNKVSLSKNKTDQTFICAFYFQLSRLTNKTR